MVQGSTRWSLFYNAICLFTLAAMVFAIATSLRFLHTPFPGFLLESSMLVSTLRYPEWSGVSAGIASYDRLLMANGHPLESPADLDRLVQSLPVGTPITYRVARKEALLDLTVPTQVFQTTDFARVHITHFVSAAIFLVIGWVVFWLRPLEPAARAHLLFCVTFTLFLSYFTIFVTVHAFPRALLCGLYLLGSTGIHLALTFPTPGKWLRRNPWGELLPYIPPLFIIIPLCILFRPLGFSAPHQLVDLYVAQLNVWSAWTVLAILFIIGKCAYLAWRGPNRQTKNQASVVLIGAIASFLPAVLVFLIPQLMGRVGSVPTWLFALEMACFHLFPLSIAYAIVRHQLFDIRLVIRRTTLYALLIAGLALLYLVVAGIAFALLGRFFPTHSGPSLPGFIAALTVALAFRPFHDHLRRGIDRLFLGERANALQVLARFSQKALPDEPTVAQELLKVVEQALQPRWVCLILADQTRSVLGEAPSYLEGACKGSNKTGILSLRDLVPEANDQALALTFKVACDRQHCLFIGPAESEMPYNSDEHAMLRALAGQAAIAFQNAHLNEERVQLLVQEGIARHKATERKQLLMQIVHDIKSDLFNISLALHLAKTRSDHPDALASIKRSLERIDSLLSEKVSVIKDGRELGTCSLLPALEDAMAILAPQIAQKEQWLDFWGPESDGEVALSPIELKQVILNLLSNASKFSPPGTRITLEARVTEESVVLTVSDEGPGIPDSLLTDLGTGKRADSSIPGSGFGLQNVKAIVEAIGGTLSCHNRSVGATFVVQLPKAVAAGLAKPEGPPIR